MIGPAVDHRKDMNLQRVMRITKCPWPPATAQDGTRELREKLDECHADLREAQQQLGNQSGMNNPAPNCATLANTLASSLNTLDVICEDIYHISEWAANARNEVTNQGSSFDGLVDRMYTAIQRCQAAGRAA